MLGPLGSGDQGALNCAGAIPGVDVALFGGFKICPIVFAMDSSA